MDWQTSMPVSLSMVQFLGVTGPLGGLHSIEQQLWESLDSSQYSAMHQYPYSQILPFCDAQVLVGFGSGAGGCSGVSGGVHSLLRTSFFTPTSL